MVSLLRRAYRKSPPSYSWDPPPTPTTSSYPFLPNWGLTTPVKNCIANCGKTVPYTTVVCIDIL